MDDRFFAPNAVAGNLDTDVVTFPKNYKLAGRIISMLWQRNMRSSQGHTLATQTGFGGHPSLSEAVSTTFAYRST